uniref:Nanos-like protein n=1 Tax=Isodiametra pulchra TaxID=504439 RepID=D2T1E1_ISOPU|nr:nanos-like protein [Isodiametra pulchra]
MNFRVNRLASTVPDFPRVVPLLERPMPLNLNPYYSPYSDYLGLANILERNVLVDNIERHVQKTCPLPGADIFSELDRLFNSNETRSRLPSDGWSDSGFSGSGESLSPVSPNSCQSKARDSCLSNAQCAPRTPPSIQLARKLNAKHCCVFCKNNGEMESVYASHVLKNEEGVIVCPILRAYTCPICGVSGDNAHTIKYCPQGNNESTIKALKQTRNSTARRTQQQITTLQNSQAVPSLLSSSIFSMKKY